jgi:hypothetical protein
MTEKEDLARQHVEDLEKAWLIEGGHTVSMCHNKKCNSPATVRAFWPGESPPPEYCTDCAAKLRAIADAIGLVVHEETIDD